RSQQQNPVGAWTFVYVPYCSGDVHVGDARDVAVPGVDGVQQFQGRANLRRFLEYLRPLVVSSSERIVLTGVSAGGIGALLNFGFVQRVFAMVPVALVDDSGPVMSVAHVPACYNKLRRQYWGFDRTVIAECGDDCDPQGDFMLQAARKLVGGTAQRTGLIQSL